MGEIGHGETQGHASRFQDLLNKAKKTLHMNRKPTGVFGVYRPHEYRTVPQDQLDYEINQQKKNATKINLPTEILKHLDQ